MIIGHSVLEDNYIYASEVWLPLDLVTEWPFWAVL